MDLLDGILVGQGNVSTYLCVCIYALKRSMEKCIYLKFFYFYRA
jgi:hypothetical protein